MSLLGPIQRYIAIGRIHRLDHVNRTLSLAAQIPGICAKPPPLSVTLTT